MTCPICGAQMRVTDTVSTKSRIYRRRVCKADAAHVKYTIEGIAADESAAEETLGKLRYKQRNSLSERG